MEKNTKKSVKVIVLRTAGTNNDIETVYAFKCAGADVVDLVHINRLFKKEVSILSYDILVIPGGFSYGDDISAGKVFANKLEYKLTDELKKFVDRNKIVIGICNGFQVLVKAGLLPGNNSSPSCIRQAVTLTFNDSGKFECRWVHLKKVPGCWTKNLPEIIQLPVAHAEGKFFTDSKKTLQELEKNGQVIFYYCDPEGKEASYPWNPNGSVNNIAGITNQQGNVFGLMPHPERYISKFQSPVWTRTLHRPSNAGEVCEPAGLTIFKNTIALARRT